MKGLKETKQVPKSQKGIKRPRKPRKEEDIRKKHPTTHELEKMRKYHTFMSALIKTVDPFTTNKLEIEGFQIQQLTEGEISHTEVQQLFDEIIQKPSKHKKSKYYSEFLEIKKRYDLVWNLDESGEDSFTSQRFSQYLDQYPISSEVQGICDFITNIRNSPAQSRIDRRQLCVKARRLQDQYDKVLELSKQGLVDMLYSKLSQLDPSPGQQLSVQEQLTLLRGVVKYMGDWEKISREFKDRLISVSELKCHWRFLKAIMRQEVAEIKLKYPNFHYNKWLRMAIRKLEHQSGSKRRNKPPPLVDLRGCAKHADMLTILATVDFQKVYGVQGVSNYNLSNVSAFKKIEGDL